jgi:hypothetical protein
MNEESEREEIMREIIEDERHEYEDAQRDMWINDNLHELKREFMETYSSEFKEFCNESYSQYRGD